MTCLEQILRDSTLCYTEEKKPYRFEQHDRFKIKVIHSAYETMFCESTYNTVVKFGVGKIF